MELLSIFSIAIALSMDAFSVAITCGVKLNTFQFYKYLKISVLFAVFQALMPLGGWFLGSFANNFISKYSMWISFSMFFFLGTKILYDTFFSKDQSCNTPCNCENHVCLISLAFATSIDAFLVGIILSLYKTIPFTISLPIIGTTTLVFSLAGCFIGNRANKLLKNRAQILAGIILLALAISSFF